MLNNCFRYAPRDSVPGLIAKICKYLKDHPGWSEEELEEQIRQLIGQNSVESFNGRTGVVMLNENDVNSLKIASAYFAEGDETINDLDLITLYSEGVRFVFTNWNSVISGYDLAFVLDYFKGSNDVVYYPISTGSSGGGNIVSVNGKTGVVDLTLSDILGDSGAQVKLCTATEFTANTADTWNAYYEDGYRIVGVVNSDATAIDYIYLLKQDENNHQPIGLSAGASDAYTPTNPPPYPVTSVNGANGAVTVTELRYGSKTPGVSSATIQLVKGRTPYVQTDGAGDYEGMSFAAYFDTVKDKVMHRVAIPGKGTRFVEEYNTLNPPPYPVTSVNDRTGDVVGLYDADNPPPYPVTSVNNRTGDVVGLYDADNPPPYPVTSVNGKTGAVRTIEVYNNGKNYAPDTMPYIGVYKSGIIYSVDSNNVAHNHYSDVNKPPYPVTSVNGMTGAVTGLYSQSNPPPTFNIVKLSPPTFSNEGTNAVIVYFADIATHPNAKAVILRYGCSAREDCSFEINNEGYILAMGVIDSDAEQFAPFVTGFVTFPYSVLSNGYFTLTASSLKAGTLMYTRNSEWEAWVIE